MGSFFLCFFCVHKKARAGVRVGYGDSLYVYVLLWLQGGLNPPIFQHFPARSDQPSWYGGTATHLITFITGCMSQASEIVLSRVHSRALLAQVTLREGQRALALLFSSEQGHPAAKGTSVQPG